jgi:hypothetical protein
MALDGDSAEIRSRIEMLEHEMSRLETAIDLALAG